MDQSQSVQLHRRGLLKLPTEILVLISSSVQSRKDLMSLTRVCRRFYDIAEPFLYSSVLLRNYEDAASLIYSLCSHQRRALHIRDLALHFANERRAGPVPALLPSLDLFSRELLRTPLDEIVPKEYLDHSLVISFLGLMSNLQELSIDFHDKEDKALENIFRKALQPSLGSNYLSFLTNCPSTLIKNLLSNNYIYADHSAAGTLRFWSEKGFEWSLSHRASVFHVQTIRCLTIIEAKADADAIDELLPFDKSTSLEELHFLGCGIHPYILAHILRFPKALRCLAIIDDRGPYDPNDYINAMHRQYSTLESLILVRESQIGRDPIQLERLPKLSFLQIRPLVLWRSFLNESALGAPLLNVEELVLVYSSHDDDEIRLLMNQVVKRLFDEKLFHKMRPALKRVTLVYSGSVIAEVPPLVARAARKAESEMVYIHNDHGSFSSVLWDQRSQSVKKFLYRYRS